MAPGDVLSYVPFFTARVVKWHTRMLEVHVERSVGVRVPPRAPSQRGRRKAVFLFSCSSFSVLHEDTGALPERLADWLIS